MFVRTWGITWKAMEHDLKHVTLILTCCAKLHNIKVDAWIAKGKHTGRNYVPNVPSRSQIDLTSLGPLPTQEEVMLRMENKYNELKVRALGCNIRDDLTKKLWEEGWRVSADQVINHNRR